MLFIIAFIAGVLTVLAPCILPLLPVILAGGVRNTRSAYQSLFTITAALAVSVFVFTFALRLSSTFVTIPPTMWALVSGGILMLFGTTLLTPSFIERIPRLGRLQGRLHRAIGRFSGRGTFWGDIVVGSVLGPIFTTCSPTYFVVLATVLPVNFGLGVAYLLSYIAGLCLMLLMVGLAGQALVARLGFSIEPRGWFRRGIGLVFILIGLMVATGLDKSLERKLLDAGLYDVTRLEILLRRYLLSETSGSYTPLPFFADTTERISQKEMHYTRAPEFEKPAGYLNTGGVPIRLEDFRGKNVVLLDVWTYSCINCQRTIPYLNAWHETYRDDGLVVIGIHTPEFAFERDYENVRWAVEQLGVKYPTVLDNEYETWRALGNDYWPRKYLVDIDGFIVYDHIGEGSYEATEAAIQRALMERAMVVGSTSMSHELVSSELVEHNKDGIRSRELYFGAQRNVRLGNGQPYAEGAGSFILREPFVPGAYYLGGGWDVMPEFARSRGKTRVVIPYAARDVYMVAGSDEPVRVRVLRDGMPITDAAGDDVDSGFVEVTGHRLYRIIEGDYVGEHVMELEIEGAGLRIYTVTFG